MSTSAPMAMSALFRGSGPSPTSPKRSSEAPTTPPVAAAAATARRRGQSCRLSRAIADEEKSPKEDELPLPRGLGLENRCPEREGWRPAVAVAAAGETATTTATCAPMVLICATVQHGHHPPILLSSSFFSEGHLPYSAAPTAARTVLHCYRNCTVRRDEYSYSYCVRERERE